MPKNPRRTILKVRSADFVGCLNGIGVCISHGDAMAVTTLEEEHRQGRHQWPSIQWDRGPYPLTIRRWRSTC